MAKKKKEQQPQYYVSPINTKVLNYGVYEMKTTEKLIYSIGLLFIGGTIGKVFYGDLFMKDGIATTMTSISNIIVFVVVGLLAIKYFLPNIIESKRKKRVDMLKQQFCDFLSALANALSTGMNMNDSLIAVHKDLCEQFSEDALIVKEVQEIIGGVNNNIAVEDMIKQLGIRSGAEDIMNFATVFSTCYRTGGDIKSVVRRTSDIISEKVMITSEIETALTSNKMQMNIMNVLPIVIVFIMRNMSPVFSQSFGTIIGVIGLTVTVILTVVAYRMGHKIMNIKG